MVLNSSLVAAVANLSANVCQYIACNPERLSSDQVLHLLFCLPVQQFRRLALRLWPAVKGILSSYEFPSLDVR